MAPILRGFTLALLALTLIACSSSDDDDSGDANVLPEFQEPSTTLDDADVSTDITDADVDSEIDVDSDADVNVDNTTSVVDSDSDGLSDSDEIALGLDPNNPDTDGDGEDDGNDAFPLASSLVDSDGDLLSDQDEELMGLNPGNPDTDGDGVDDGNDPFPNDEAQGGLVVPVDTDGDLLTDEQELALGLDPTNPDTDGDGVNDGDDPFPNDVSASIDTDGDGVSDDRDEFPNDATETSDLNGDGLGDNANPFDGIVISGVVVGAVDQSPVNGAKVALDLVNTGAGTNPVVVATTNSAGEYSLIAEASLVPDSFAIVVTADNFNPAAIALSNSDDAIDVESIELDEISDSFIKLEIDPTVHHLGDDTFSGSENSQFQRTTEGPVLLRNFNLTETQASTEILEMIWVAKGIQSANTISINGSVVATTPETNSDGSFTPQIITLEVVGILTTGSNTLTIESVLSDADSSLDIDDFEFVLLGLQ